MDRNFKQSSSATKNALYPITTTYFNDGTFAAYVPTGEKEPLTIRGQFEVLGDHTIKETIAESTNTDLVGQSNILTVDFLADRMTVISDEKDSEIHKSGALEEIFVKSP